MTMNNKLSNPVISKLSFLTLKELQNILKNFNDSYDNDRYETWKHIVKTYSDEQIIPLLKASPEHASNDKRTQEEKLQELKSYYVKNEEITVTTNDIPVFKRGRKKQDKTLKDTIFDLLNDVNKELSYKEVLESGVLNIAENTYKTILSAWRKEKGIIVKRGRKSNG